MRFLFIPILLAVGFFAQAQSPMAVLKADDVDKFIKTLNPMKQELNALGYSLDNDESEDVAGAIQANAKALAILKKYGWEIDMWAKWTSIGMCYAKLKMDEQMAGLPAEQREQMQQMMKMAGQTMDNMVNADDLKLVKDRMKELDIVFEEN